MGSIKGCYETGKVIGRETITVNGANKNQTTKSKEEISLKSGIDGGIISKIISAT